MDLLFGGTIFSWRGPAPYHFVALPEEQSAQVRSAAALVTYGWGMVPVTARIAGTTWTTSLFPKDGGYLLPLKDAVRRAEDLAEGDHVSIRLTIDA